MKVLICFNSRYADDNLNRVAAELDSFDGRKDPERCAALVSRLRSCQDKLLNICNRWEIGNKMMAAEMLINQRDIILGSPELYLVR